MGADSTAQDIDRRSVLKGIAVTAGAASFAGCTGGIPGTGSGGGDGELLFWASPFDDEVWDPWKKWFQNRWQKNHDSPITLSPFTYEDMRQKFLSGGRQGRPDAIEGVLENLSEYIKADLVEPITEQAEGLKFSDGYIDGAWDAMTYQGEVYGLPYFGNGRALIYRKDIFERNNLQPPKTAKEFHEVARTIKKNEDITPFNNCTKKGGVRAFQEWISHVFQYHDNLYTREGDSWKLQASPDTLGKIFKTFYYEPWASDNAFCNPDNRGQGYQANDPGYLNGDIAMIECGTWLMGWTSGPEINNENQTAKLLEENTGVAQLPYAKGGNIGTYLEVKPVMVNKHSNNKEQAFDLISTFCSPESMKQMPRDIRLTPVHKDLSSKLEVDAWKPFTEVMKVGKPLAKITWGPVMDEYYDEMQEVVYGRKKPMKAGADLHSRLKKLETEV